MLRVAGADHDVAHTEGRIEAARHAAQHQRSAAETVKQQGRGDTGIDLAGARFHEHRRAAGDLALPEGHAANPALLARQIREMGKFLGQCRYDAEEPVCHGRMGYKFAAPMSMTLPDLKTLRDACSVFARDAAAEIMRIYAGDHGARDKADKSPVTDADHAAEVIIVAGLRALTPGRPVVAEEEMAAGRLPGLDGGPFWLVDPLDGTKEFIKKNGEFTVNIALVEDGKVTLGIVLAPATDTLWRGASGLGADKSQDGGAFIRITTRSPPPEGLTAFASRSTAIFSNLDIWFRNEGLTVAERKHAGSSLKFCLIAEGLADIYPRFGPTNEWDTAAGQGVLEAAGGEVVTTDGKPLGYGKPRFSNPHFIARTKGAR